MRHLKNFKKPSPSLEDQLDGANTLNLVRLLLAVLVLVSHSSPLGYGRPDVGFFGHSLGGIAVGGFFFLSGVLIAGSYVAQEVECLAEDGRLVIIAVQGGLKAEFNAGLVLRRRLQITGSTLRPRPVEFKAAVAQKLKTKVWPFLETSQIKPIIFKSFAPSDAVAAHALMESNQHIGKIMLDWSLL